MKDFEIGDKVLVLDQGLLALQKFFPKSKPNNYGKVAEILSDGSIMVEFQIGKKKDNHSQVAPYPKHLVKHICVKNS